MLKVWCSGVRGFADGFRFGFDPMRSMTTGAPILSHIMFLLICFRRSTPPQNRQLIVDFCQLKCYVDGVIGELTF